MDTPTSPRDTSPNTVCITFVQSRHTKIQYHEDVPDDESDDEAWGDFKGAGEGFNGVIGGSAFATTEYMGAKDNGF